MKNTDNDKKKKKRGRTPRNQGSFQPKSQGSSSLEELPKASLEELHLRQKYILNCRNRYVSNNLINALSNANISFIQQPQTVSTNKHSDTLNNQQNTNSAVHQPQVFPLSNDIVFSNVSTIVKQPQPKSHTKNTLTSISIAEQPQKFPFSNMRDVSNRNISTIHKQFQNFLPSNTKKAPACSIPPQQQFLSSSSSIVSNSNTSTVHQQPQRHFPQSSNADNVSNSNFFEQSRFPQSVVAKQVSNTIVSTTQESYQTFVNRSPVGQAPVSQTACQTPIWDNGYKSLFNCPLCNLDMLLDHYPKCSENRDASKHTPQTPPTTAAVVCTPRETVQYKSPKSLAEKLLLGACSHHQGHHPTVNPTHKQASCVSTLTTASRTTVSQHLQMSSKPTQCSNRHLPSSKQTKSSIQQVPPESTMFVAMQQTSSKSTLKQMNHHNISKVVTNQPVIKQASIKNKVQDVFTAYRTMNGIFLPSPIQQGKFALKPSAQCSIVTTKRSQSETVISNPNSTNSISISNVIIPVHNLVKYTFIPHSTVPLTNFSTSETITRPEKNTTGKQSVASPPKDGPPLRQTQPEETVSRYIDPPVPKRSPRQRVSPLIIKLNKLKEKRKAYRMKKSESHKTAEAAIKKKKRKKKKKKESACEEEAKENLNPTDVAPCDGDSLALQRKSVIKRRKQHGKRLKSSTCGAAVKESRNNCSDVVDLTSLTSTASESEMAEEAIRYRSKKVSSHFNKQQQQQQQPKCDRENPLVEMSSPIKDDVIMEESPWRTTDEIERGVSLDDVFHQSLSTPSFNRGLHQHNTSRVHQYSNMGNYVLPTVPIASNYSVPPLPATALQAVPIPFQGIPPPTPLPSFHPYLQPQYQLPFFVQSPFRQTGQYNQVVYDRVYSSFK